MIPKAFFKNSVEHAETLSIFELEPVSHHRLKLRN